MAFKKKAIAKEVQAKIDSFESYYMPWTNRDQQLKILYGIGRYDERGSTTGINTLLRDRSTNMDIHVENPDTKWNREFAKALQEDLRVIESKPRITYRGMIQGADDYRDGAYKVGSGEILARQIGLQPDKPFYDKAFMATTPNRDYADRYGKDITLEVMGSAGSIMSTRHENMGGEVVYPAGNQFDVENYRVDGEKVTARLVDRNLSPRNIVALKEQAVSDSLKRKTLKETKHSGSDLALTYLDNAKTYYKQFKSSQDAKDGRSYVEKLGAIDAQRKFMENEYFADRIDYEEYSAKRKGFNNASGELLDDFMKRFPSKLFADVVNLEEIRPLFTKSARLSRLPNLGESLQESRTVEVGRYNSNLFEYGQKVVDKQTGEVKSLVSADGQTLRVMGIDGANSDLGVTDFKIKAPSNMKSFNLGDGLINNNSDLRYTVLGNDGEYVKLLGLNGDTREIPVSQIKKEFRANSLGFGTFPAITSGLLGTAGIIGGATAGKLLAKSLGANEDQQNIAAGIGGAIGGLTGVTTGYIGEGATMPKSFQEMAKRAIGVRANSEAGAFYPANPEIMQRQADRLKAKGYTDAKLESFDPMKGWYEALVDDVKTNYTSDFGATRDRLNSQLADKSISLDRPNPEIEARLIDASNRLNVPVTNSDKFKDNRLGVQKTAIDPTSPTGFKSRIVINNNLANGRAYSPTLAHELGHYVLKHGETQLSTTNFDGLSVPLNEVQAEAVSYGVMKKLGLADNPKLSEIGDLRKNYIGAYANKLPSPILLDASQNLVEDAVNQIIPESTESLKLIRGERTQLMANKKINDGSVSSSVKEPKPQKLTTDTLYKYLQMMGGEPVIVKPDGKQATKGKFAFGQDIGLNNEFTKLPEIHTRFDDPKIASMVAKELATGELTVGMQRNPETGEVETMTKRFEPIPSRGNTQLRRYKLQNDTSGYVDPETKKWVDTSGTYLAFNKPEEAYKAPKSLKELQREARSQQFQLDSAYKELNVSPDMSKRDYLSAIKPRMAELEANEPLRQQAKLVLDDIVSRVPAAPDPQSSQLTQYVKQAAIASEPQQLLNSARDTGGWANAVGESYDVSRSQPEPTFKNLEPRFRAEMGNFLNPTGLSDRAAYDRAKTGYEGYQDLGYAPKDKSFPDFYDLQRQSKAEGVRPEAFQNYIKGKQNAPLIEAGVITPPELPMTARLGQEYISPKTGNVGTVESVGKKGVKLNVDGQVVPVEYQTLEKLKYTGNKGYGFSTPAALRPVLGAFAGGTAGSTLFKQLAKSAGLDEDQQNAAAATGGLIGSFTGSALTNVSANTKLRMPTPQEFAKTMMSAPQSKSAGARLFDLASSESGALSMEQRQKASDFNQQYESGAIAKESYSNKRSPMQKLALDESAAIMGMSPDEYRKFQDRAYKEFPVKTESSKGSGKPPKYVEPARFSTDPKTGDRYDMQSFREANTEWRRSTDEATKPLREAYDQAIKSGDKELQKAAIEAMDEIKVNLPPAPVKSDFIAPLQKPVKASDRKMFDMGAMSESAMDSRRSQRVQGDAPMTGYQRKFGLLDEATGEIVKPKSGFQQLLGNVTDAVFQPKKSSGGFAKSAPSLPKQSNFVSESTVEAAAKSSGATTAQVKAQIANQRSTGAAPDLAKATEAIATAKQRRSLQGVTLPEPIMQLSGLAEPKPFNNEVGKQAAFERSNLVFEQNVSQPRSLRQLQQSTRSPQQFTFNPPMPETQISTRAKTPTYDLPAADFVPLKNPNTIIDRKINQIDSALKAPVGGKIGDRIGASGLGIFMDTAQAAQVLTESASRGENAPTALTRAGLSAGTGYATTALASFIPNPYLRTAAQLGGGIAAVVGADKAIDQVVGRNEAKEQKYAKDLSKLDLQATDEKEQWKPFANDSNIAAAYGNSLTAQIQQNLDYRPAARSLANLANSNQVNPNRQASARSAAPKVTGQQLSAALSAERKAQGLKYGEVLSDSAVAGVFGSLAGTKSLSDLRRSQSPIKAKPLQRFGSAVGIGR